MRSKPKTFVILGLLLFGIAFLGAQAVQAQVNGDQLGLNYASATGLGSEDIRVVVARIIQYALGFLGIVALVLIIYGGFRYMTAGGDQEKVDTAKRIITQAVIGLAIILASFAIASFVVSRLLIATGANTGGGDGGPPGSGGCPGCTLPIGEFTVGSIVPPGDAASDKTFPKNSQVTVVFRNGSPDPNTVDGALSVKQGDQEISGTITASGNKIVFTPTAECSENTAYRCLPGNSQFTVSVLSSILSTTGRSLVCGLCSASFLTNDTIDVSGPLVVMASPQDSASVPANSIVRLIADATDDGGVAGVDFLADNDLVGTGDPMQIDWDTTGKTEGSSVALKAVAIDTAGNSSTSLPVTVIVRPAHCFNNIQDEGETGPDCGDGCGECQAGACSANSQCASGLCENGVCASRPQIDYVDPGSGGPGTLITVKGSGFGFSPGQITFLGGSGEADDKTAAPCVPSAWTNNEVRVAVPEGAVTGPLVLTTADGKSDATNDANGNASIPDFIVNTDVRPGICLITPGFGPAGTSAVLTGNGFGEQTAAVTVAGRSATVDSWAGTSIAFTVPNLLAGAWPVKVSVLGKTSNSVGFEIPVAGGGPPHLLSLDPERGPVGEYVTISGDRLGDAIGKVYFASGPDKVLADTDFPEACSKTFWRETSVIVKVPDGLPVGNLVVTLERAGTVSDNSLPFGLENGTPDPGICSVNPESGPPSTPYALNGEGFTSPVTGRVTFWNDVDASAGITGWQDTQVNGSVPAAAATGPVSLASPQGLRSNSVLFTVANCKEQADVCSGRTECCDDGSCRTANADGTSGCTPAPKVGAYRFRFSTGDVPRVPAVVDNFECAVNTQSPSPYRNTTDACVNAVPSVRFTINMDDDTLAKDNFILRECGTADEFAAAACTEDVSGTVTPWKSAQDLQEGMKLVPDQKLKPGVWYQGRIVSGAGEAAGKTGVRSAAGLPMDEDFVWHFRTATLDSPCTLASVTVIPAENKLTDLYTYDPENPQENVNFTNYEAAPAAANCNLLQCVDYAWSWMSNSRSAEVAAASNTCYSQVRAARQTEPAKPALISATATKELKTGTGTLEIKFADPAVISKWPDCQSACLEAEVGALFNTVLRGTSVNRNTFKLFICNNETCASYPQEVAGTADYYDTSVSGVARHLVKISMVEPLLENTYYRAMVMGGANGVLSSAGAKLDESKTNGSYSVSGVATPVYTWVFRTSDKHCVVDRVDMSPDKLSSNRVGTYHQITAVPVTAPDECSVAGQRVASTGMDWNWSVAPDPAGAAELYKEKGAVLNVLPLSSPYATSSCLNAGTPAKRPVCGNGIIENGRGVPKTGSAEGGEECDLGADANSESLNGAPGQGCSANCLSTGDKDVKDDKGVALCGNGKIDDYSIAGVAYKEQCDDGNTADRDGCSGACLREGSLFGPNPSTCGNKDMADNEQCDDGNPVSGDGCSSICTNEGSAASSGPMCGNGKTEQGEDCDPPDVSSSKPWGCDAGCRFTGSSPCTLATSADGQTSCCGNNQVDPGEDPSCDLGFNEKKLRPSVEEGCDNSCRKTGSSFSYSTLSVCGNATVQTGEMTDPGSSDERIDPTQYAVAVGKPGDQLDADGRMTTKIKAEVGGKSGSADFTLQCGFKDDSQCPEGTKVGSNTCCYPPPKITSRSPLPDAGIKAGTAKVCRNPAISVEFDRLMNPGTFTGNFLLGAPAGPNGCGDAGKVVKVDEPRGLWARIRGFFSRLIGFILPKRAVAADSFCAAPAIVQVSDVGIGTDKHSIARLRLDGPLNPETVYKLKVSGDVRSSDGVKLGADSTWTFKTGSDICTLDMVKVDPLSWLFTELNEEKQFAAVAVHLDGSTEQPIQPIANVYDWKMEWVSSVKELVNPNDPNADPATVKVLKAENGEATLTAAARITADTVNTPSTAPRTVDGETVYTTLSGTSAITVLLCQNPWPERKAGQSWQPAYNAEYGYTFYYCRDGESDGKGGMDLLPYLKEAPTSNKPPSDPNDPRTYLLQNLYTYDGSKPGTDLAARPELAREAVGIRIWPNLDLLTTGEWFARQGFRGSPSPVRVDGYDGMRDGRTVYVSAPTIKPAGPRNYINMFVLSYSDSAGADTQNVFNQILNNLLFAANRDSNGLPIYNDNNYCVLDAAVACSSDLDCVTQDKGVVCSAERSKIRRDVKRLMDMRLIADAAGRAKDKTGNYPQLVAGTFLPGRSVSTWPSWTGEFAVELGGTPPGDPLNKLAACPAEGGYEAGTCWSTAGQKFVCPTNSQVYQYVSSPAYGFSVSADFESNEYSGFRFRSDLDTQDKCNADPLYLWRPGYSPSCQPRFEIDPPCSSNTVRSAVSQQCGNGSVESPTEQCDPPNKQTTIQRYSSCNGGPATVSCSADCRTVRYECLAIKCGNGVREGTEACDDGVRNGSYGNCNTSCTGPGPRCGDGIKQEAAGELCDNGQYNGQYNSGCSLDCRSNGPACGDGKVEAGFESCDGNSEAAANPDGRSSCQPVNGYPAEYVRACKSDCSWGDWSCQQKGKCGNTIIEAGEDCEGTGTTGACVNCKKAYCGDNYIRSGVEQCDDGGRNIMPGDQTSINQRRADCQFSTCYYCTTSCVMGAVSGAFCGDGVIQASEQCDDGIGNINSTNKDALIQKQAACTAAGGTGPGCQYCDQECKVAEVPRCGDGKQGSDESCDAGADNGRSGSGCDLSCRCTGDGFYSGKLAGTVTVNSDYNTGVVPVAAVSQVLGWWPVIDGATPVWAPNTRSSQHQYFKFPINLNHAPASAKLVIGADNHFRVRLDDPAGAILAESDNYQEPVIVDVTAALAGNLEHTLYIEAWNWDDNTEVGLWFALVAKPDCAQIGAIPVCHATGFNVLSGTDTKIVNYYKTPGAAASTWTNPTLPIQSSLISNPPWPSYASQSNDPKISGASWIWYSSDSNTYRGYGSREDNKEEHVVFQKTVNLPGKPDEVNISLMADDAINIKMNNRADVCHLDAGAYCPGGNCAVNMFINSCTVTSFLQSGNNTIDLDVANWNTHGGLLFKMTFGTDCGVGESTPAPALTGSCGNGVLDTGEKCDTKIAPGAVGGCGTGQYCASNCSGCLLN